MKKDFAKLTQLESLSTADLIMIANDYGIDIPANLNRRFIIGELLEAADFFSNDEESNLKIQNDESEDSSYELPFSYNNTYIDMIIRNPAWVFVFWDIKESDLQKFQQKSNFETLFLHVGFYEWADDEKPEYSFDINIDTITREQYVMIPSDKKFVRIDLCAQYTKTPVDILASTKVFEIPSESEKIRNMQPGKKLECSPLVELSGIKKILHDHYLNHRQSFSDN